MKVFLMKYRKLTPNSFRPTKTHYIRRFWQSFEICHCEFLYFSYSA